ncbi:uncharacterized protein LOC133318896 [Danaus plexippus]|uniref:Seminal fluid protein HACP057 n=1 Tax=Danaus plexippus plexippus TaxID=278856 RepID=A0A212FL76_DANPL|nr:uncharacterized protein LOC133318896 [Danaus plexippus]OWR54494.1 seminal fluid protein HACP057 [Danaus plexippus plexippus]
MQLTGYVIFLTLCGFTIATKPFYDVYEAPKLFEKFMADYDKHYKDQIDTANHYNAFLASLVTINKGNRDSPLTTYDINHLADYTPEEIDSTLNGLKHN